MKTFGRAVTVFALVAVGSMLFPATSLGDTYNVKAAGSFGNFHYQPEERHMLKNDKIRFKNPSSQSTNHTFTAYGGNWEYDKELAPGETATRKFRHKGVFKFRCRFHSQLVGDQCNGMCGKVRVHSF